MSLTSLMTNTCSIQRPVWGTDNAGGPVRTSATTLGSNIPCFIMTRGASAVEYFDSFQMELSHIVITQSTLAAKGDWVLVDGLFLRIDGIQQRRARGTIPAFYVLGCIEIKE